MNKAVFLVDFQANGEEIIHLLELDASGSMKQDYNTGESAVACLDQVYHPVVDGC